ncbi:MAG: cell division protein ZapA [Alphaproteobacteria bacterium]|nr:MAG: cell division protein ZapA [Alphaproteobacteria bacterium]
MAQVTLTVNKRSFTIACEEGQEKRLEKLAAYVDERVQNISAAGVVRTESNLMSLTAILLADELLEAQDSAPQSGNNDNAEDFSKKLQEALQKQETEYAKQVDALTDSVEKLAESLK